MPITNKKAYSEVYAVLSVLDNEYLQKIPDNILKFIAENRDKTLNIRINPGIPLEEQSLSAECLAILAMLKLDYWCRSEEEKQKLQSILDFNDKTPDGTLSAADKKIWIELLKNKIGK